MSERPFPRNPPVALLLFYPLVVVLGLAGLGRTIQYIPWPVIEGFTVGIATIISGIPAATSESMTSSRCPSFVQFVSSPHAPCR